MKKGDIRVQMWVVCIGVLLLAAKFFAYWLTLSNTILTDALESIVNVVAGGLGLYSLLVAAIPKDENHPYGHGKIEFISAGIEGTLIVLAGAAILYQSLYSFWSPGSLHSLDWGIYIGGAAGLVNWLLGRWVERRGKQTGSIALVAGGKHLQSDAYSSAGMLLGLLAIFFTGWVWLDSAVALLFGCIIVWTGIGIVRESVAGMMDQADETLVHQVVEILNAHRTPNWIDVHNLRIIKYGSDLHIDCHLTVPFYFNVIEAHNEVDELEELLRRELNGRVEFFIHVDACVPTSCHLCTKTDCPQRMETFKASLPWTDDLVMRNKKHGMSDK